MRTGEKVFGIGFHKTGTTSLANALYILGYNVAGYYGAHDLNICETVYDQAFALSNRFDAAQDTPWFVLYKELDQWFPGSKFILTIRPTDQWIQSVAHHFKNHYIPAHEWIYGVRTAIGNKQVYIQRYEKHNCEAIEYFKYRPNDFMVMDITQGDGWEKLCPFLNQEMPPFPFPSQNRNVDKPKHIIKRGARLLSKKTIQNNWPNRESQMWQGVSATFLRDILHYHYSTFDLIWNGLKQVGEEQFVQGNHLLEGSLCNHMFRQVAEEETWYRRLTRLTEDSTEDEDTTEELEASHVSYKEAVYQRWKNTRLLLRQHAANLTDEDCNQRIAGGAYYVWEVYMHLMSFGIEQRFQIRNLLQNYGIEVTEPTILDFYHVPTHKFGKL